MRGITSARNSLAGRSRRSDFIDAAAVDAWDAWYRWREGSELRDVSIFDTWTRIATALAGAECANAERWKQWLLDAISEWRLVLDEQILRSAGTESNVWSGTLVCAVNLPAFVQSPLSAQASFDFGLFGRSVALAVHALDNALCIAANKLKRVSVGIIGLADSLALLDLRYDSPAACDFVHQVGRMLAQMSQEESIALACERGAQTPFDYALEQRAKSRGLAADLIGDARRHGVRHSDLTSVQSHRRLALTANNVADAMDPLYGLNQRNTIADEGTAKTIVSSGCALTLLQRSTGGSLPDRFEADLIERVPVAAQLRLRAAINTWIDQPVSYPICVATAPKAHELVEWAEMASGLGLAPCDWRHVNSPLPLDRAATS